MDFTEQVREAFFRETYFFREAFMDFMEQVREA